MQVRWETAVSRENLSTTLAHKEDGISTGVTPSRAEIISKRNYLQLLGRKRLREPSRKKHNDPWGYGCQNRARITVVWKVNLKAPERGISLSS